MGEWRHVPAELPKSRHDPKPVWCAFCGSLDTPWPCDAETMRRERDAAVSARQEAERVLERVVALFEGSYTYAESRDALNEARATLVRTREPAGDVNEGAES